MTVKIYQISFSHFKIISVFNQPILYLFLPLFSRPVGLKVWSTMSITWQLVRNANLSGPTPDLRNQKLWEMTQQCVVTNLPGDSNAPPKPENQ